MSRATRGGWLFATIAAFTLSALLAPAVYAGTCTGVVYLDANANGQRDEGEAGMEGCTVSADCPAATSEPIFAVSGADGAYELQLPDGPAVIFVVNPSQTWPTGEWWYYTADGSDGADFGLRADEQSTPFNVVHGTDMHITHATVDRYRLYQQHVKELPIDIAFVMHTGDLVLDTNRSTSEQARALFDLYIESTMVGEPLGAPVRNLSGNHEVVGMRLEDVPLDAPEQGKDLYRRMLGPTTYAFVYAGYHIIALDATRVVDRNYKSGLTDASADWAVAYLERLEEGAHVVLALHEGFWGKEPEQRLLAALADKHLAISIYGHAHARRNYPWGGAPYVIGGAVSYAWLGLMPFPPQPYGYHLMRFGADDLEDRIYLDWAEERSFDIIFPPQPGTYGTFSGGFPGYVSGEIEVEGVISDLDDSVEEIAVAVEDVRADAVITESTPLKKQFTTPLDLNGLTDGIREIIFTAQYGGKECVEAQPIMVINGTPEPFEATEPATLRFRIVGGPGDGLQVLFNDAPLAEFSPDDMAERQAEVEVPADMLKRLNVLTFKAMGAADGLAVTQVWMTHEDRQWRDARHSPAITQILRPVEEGGLAQFVTYIDLQYDGTFTQ